MADPNVLDRMRDDWNDRAREDAHYYVAFGRRGQDDDEFFASAAQTVKVLEAELPRLPGRGAALEIGCGPGRLMRGLSRHFGRIHGVDVSDEMVRLAREKLRGVPNARVAATSGADLALFPDGCFDFVYSYAVFQHIPSRDVVFRYLEEARRVLKPEGILRCQINGLPPTAARYTTWEGVRIAAAEVAEFALGHDFQLLALEGAGTQYMWTTLRKRPEGWSRGAPKPPAARIRSVSNANTGEPAVPAAGPLAAVSLWMEQLGPEADLNRLQVRTDGQAASLTYLGHPAPDGLCQLNATLPGGLRTGLVPVEVRWLGEPLCGAWVRLVPPGPMVPRVWSVTDGVNLLAHNRAESGLLKAVVAEIERPERFEATLGGVPVRGIDRFCADPLASRYEFNFRVPESIGRGTHELVLRAGTRVLARMPVEVA